MTDCKNDGRAALKVLREHYQNAEKPRVLTLYEELTTLRMTEEKDTTDFVIRAERATNGLRSAGETISDNLVIAMLLKGLPKAYKPFVVVHTQLDKYKTLVQFKAALTNYANTEAVRTPSQASALTASKQSTRPQSQTLQQGQCLSCGKNGHRSRDYRKKTKLSCNYCQNTDILSKFVSKRRNLQQMQLRIFHLRQLQVETAPQAPKAINCQLTVALHVIS